MATYKTGVLNDEIGRYEELTVEEATEDIHRQINSLSAEALQAAEEAERAFLGVDIEHSGGLYATFCQVIRRYDELRAQARRSD